MFKVWLTIVLTVAAFFAGIAGIVIGQYIAAGGIFILSGLFGFGVWLSLAHQFRTVVAPNEVHTVQGGSGKVSYGSAKAITASLPDDGTSEIVEVAPIEFHGNAYYNWPEWWPSVGVTVVEMPLSVFALDLANYAAYDSSRVPFVVDIMAFFRVAMPDIASERIDDFDLLEVQLRSILQGAARTLLASYSVEKIMMERQVFGEKFTKEVADQLKEWGVITVKNIELMDIRDPAGEDESRVITNIQAKEQSRIEKDSRVEVAGNIKVAEIAETEAKQASDVAIEIAEQKVGEQEATKTREVGVANERARQDIQEEAALTMEKDMAVKRVDEVRSAEITKDVEIVKAEEDRDVSIVKAEGDRQEMVLQAEGTKADTTLKSEGDLAQETNRATGIQLVGQAEADAKLKLNMADVDPEITLAQEIGENTGYQNFLNAEKAILANEKIGIAAASAMSDAELKIIVNSGDTNSGVNSMMDIFSSKGGTALGAMLDAGLNTDGGKALLERMGVTVANAGPKPTVATVETLSDEDTDDKVA